MMRGATLLWALLALVVGTGLFMLKYEVQSLEDQLTSLNRQIRSDRAAVHVLEAEWSYLNDPARLRELAERHLGLAPFAPGQVGTIAQLPLRPLPKPQPLPEPQPDAATPAPLAPGAAPLVAASPVAPVKAEVAHAPGRIEP